MPLLRNNPTPHWPGRVNLPANEGSISQDIIPCTGVDKQYRVQYRLKDGEIVKQVFLEKRSEME